jgi:hypothetical protein
MLADDADYPVPSEVNIPDSFPWTDCVDRLFAASEVLSLYLDDSEIPFANRIPDRMLAIGDNEHGGIFLLSLREDSWGADYNIADALGARLLSTSFAKWLGSLVKIDSEENL